MTCSYGGKNFGMGPFEPIVCQQGWYCPPESNGRETFRCPKGSYCQPGAATPTPCNTGSYCPEGASYQVYLVPLGVLIVVDILVIIGMLFYRFRSRLFANSRAHLGSVKGLSLIHI